MKIEDRWEDYSIWYVEFQPIDKRLKNKVKKFLAFESNFSEKDISGFIFSNFSNVESIDSLEMLIDDCMKPNKRSYDEFKEDKDGVASKR